MSDHFPEWCELLDGDEDADFLLSGIRDGFHLLDPDKLDTNSPEQSLYPPNHKSALSKDNKAKVEKQLLAGITEGHYKVLQQPPKITSPISAIPKSDGGTRVIHDLSSPRVCLNSHASVDPVHYQSIEDAIALLCPGTYMAKIDLKAAYRSVRSHPSAHPWTCLHWTFEGDSKPTFLCDTRLPFGARKSPSVFHRITQAIRRYLARMGIEAIVVYLDDFFIAANNFADCERILCFLLRLLRRLTPPRRSTDNSSL